MRSNRLEAFSDGVLAIIITIMVLELKIPHDNDLSALKPLFPLFLSYVLSFVYLGIYWNNHHHLLHAVRKVTAGVLWANLHLLFWLSLFPFVTAWMGENHLKSGPTLLYGVVMLMASAAYWILQQCIIAGQDEDSAFTKAIGRDFKGMLSSLLYLAAILSTFVEHRIAWFIYVLVAVMWIIPDRRIERALGE